MSKSSKWCDQDHECPYDFILTVGCDCCQYGDADVIVACCGRKLKLIDCQWSEDKHRYVCTLGKGCNAP